LAACFLFNRASIWWKVQAFDEKSNSLVEGQNSSMKHGSMPVCPNMSLKAAAKTMLDKMEMLCSQRSVQQSKKTTKILLWSNTNITGLLTSYAEGSLTEQMECRALYNCAQGITILLSWCLCIHVMRSVLILFVLLCNSCQNCMVG